MFYAVLFFCPFSRVPGTQIACQVTGYTAHTKDAFTLAHRTFIEDNPFVTTVMTSIYRVIDRAVANPLVVHHFHNLGDGTYILLCFTVQFYIRDMSAARNGVERSFTLDFLNDADRFFHVYVERVDIIVAIFPYFRRSIFVKRPESPSAGVARTE